MFDGYPLPAHVAAIWHADGRIWIAFPPVPGKSRGHKVHVPNNVEGLTWIIKLLKTRETEKEHCIASPASPIQAQLKITEIVRVTKSPEVLELERQERREASRARQRGKTKSLDFLSLADLELDKLDLEDLGL